jgi:hypothetical protein
MFTTIDKAIAAILGGVLSVLALKFGVVLDWATPDLLASVGAVVTALLVYLVPNKGDEETAVSEEPTNEGS